MDKARKIIAKYPFISMAATAAATYYGGPKGAEYLGKIAALLGLA